LMLRPDVVAASRKRKFNIYPVETISQGIEVLTGATAGERDRSGEFPKGSVYGRVEARLREYALTRKDFGATQPQSTAQDDDT
ncbi:MAG: hypothetical protein HKP56_18360, partial [Anderseniella sp.]|nr:hypothetical protein [Anderseniella sp.]